MKYLIFFQEVAKGSNNNKVGVASNSNANLLTIMVAVMAAAVVATGTTKANNKEVTLAVRIGADFVKISFINSWNHDGISNRTVFDDGSFVLQKMSLLQPTVYCTTLNHKNRSEIDFFFSVI